MSNTYSPNLKLATPAPDDPDWNNALDANRQILDRQNAIGDLAVTTHEQPSASLMVDIAAGVFLNQAGAIVTYAGAMGVAVTASAVTSLYLTPAGVLTQSRTGFPVGTAPYIPLATIVSGTSTITSITDARCVFPVVGSPFLLLSGGTLADGANIALGTATGTQFGTAATEKLAFFGATPIVQPVNTSDLRAALIALGLLGTGGANPLNLNGGTLTAAAATISGAVAAGSLTISDGGNIVLGSTNGTQIGTSATEKLAFFGGTPVARPSDAQQAAPHRFDGRQREHHVGRDHQHVDQRPEQRDQRQLRHAQQPRRRAPLGLSRLERDQRIVLMAGSFTFSYVPPALGSAAVPIAVCTWDGQSALRPLPNVVCKRIDKRAGATRRPLSSSTCSTIPMRFRWAGRRRWKQFGRSTPTQTRISFSKTTGS